MIMNRASRIILISGAVAGCASGSGTLPGGEQPAPTVRMTRIAPDVSLEVLDWGGKGPTLVFLAGGGNTAHVFDEFAPQFTDSFHVVGITRRGFGASSGSPPPRELDTLVADITAVLDSLAIARPILVGHSIAGEEMTRFAELHPQRCRGLVYVDAAYDRSGIDTLALKQPPSPERHVRPEDTVSFASIRDVYARVTGARVPDSEIRATVRFDAADRYRGEVERYKKEKADVEKDARKLEAESQDAEARSEVELHKHHRWAQSMTLIQVSIALAAITLLTRSRGLLWVSVGAAAGAMALAGLAIGHV
jgi:pimeloyl-ACP methyl ester carboxylesterase